MKEIVLEIAAGPESEEILQVILAEMSDDQLDQVEIDRQMADSEGLVGEPVTVAVAIGASTALMVAALRVLERHLEHRRQREAFAMVAQGFEKDPELGRLYTELAGKHAEVAGKFGIAKESWSKSK